MKEIMVVESVENSIFMIRGHRVMLDRDLARLYGVSTKRLNEQVRRNIKRFPSDFMFQLVNKEVMNLRSQFATSSWGGKRYLPYVFTEQGVAMLSGVINSDRAVQVNVAIMRAFVKIREILSTHKELAHKLAGLERKIDKHDKDIGLIFEAIRQLMEPPPQKPKPTIGFHP